jgi:hypothetical protein
MIYICLGGNEMANYEIYSLIANMVIDYLSETDSKLETARKAVTLKKFVNNRYFSNIDEAFLYYYEIRKRVKDKLRLMSNDQLKFIVSDARTIKHYFDDILNK